jgi:hypothetical protein
MLLRETDKYKLEIAIKESTEGKKRREEEKIYVLLQIIMRER